MILHYEQYTSVSAALSTLKYFQKSCYWRKHPGRSDSEREERTQDVRRWFGIVFQDKDWLLLYGQRVLYSKQ